MCDKEPYPNEPAARKAANGMSRQYNESMQAYFCNVCDCWHLKTEGKRAKRKRNNNKYPFRYHPKKKGQ